MGRYLQESYDKALREVERLREEHDALATHVEHLSEAANELADLMDYVREGDYTPDSFTNQPIRAILAEVPATSLARRDARMKSEALHNAVCVLESEFDPCHPIIERVESLEAELRRQAEEKNNG